MKRIIVILLLVFFVIGSDAKAQCDTDNYANECIPQLTDGFNFLKSYKIDGQDGSKQKVEYSYVFTKGTKYMLNICAEGGNDGIVVELFDSRRKKVGSSVHKGENLSAFVYPCNTTGIYYISYTFDDSNSFCGGSALGFKK